jgi:hypothetical protein
MITYKDRAFCNSPCANTDCPRFLSNDVRKGAQKIGLPISLMSFMDECEEHIPVSHTKTPESEA